MKFVALDTNALMRNYLLREANMQTLSSRPPALSHIGIMVRNYGDSAPNYKAKASGGIV